MNKLLHILCSLLLFSIVCPLLLYIMSFLFPIERVPLNGCYGIILPVCILTGLFYSLTTLLSSTLIRFILMTIFAITIYSALWYFIATVIASGIAIPHYYLVIYPSLCVISTLLVTFIAHILID